MALKLFTLTFGDGRSLEFKANIDDLLMNDLNPLYPAANGRGYSRIEVEGYKSAYVFVITEELFI